MLLGVSSYGSDVCNRSLKVLLLAMDEKGISPCICIFNILNLNQISVIVILVVVHQRYPAALK